MKSKMALLMFCLLLLPIKANGQSSDDQVAGPRPVERWRDGYIWRGRKVVDPDWRTFNTEDGATFVVDMKSIVNISRTDQIVRVVAYLAEEEQFNSKNLISFAFDCKNKFVEIVTSVTADRLRSIEKQAHALACP
jgi:hypothetical protein